MKGLTRLPDVLGDKTIAQAIAAYVAEGIKSGSFMAMNCADIPNGETSWGYNISFYSADHTIVRATRSYSVGFWERDMVGGVWQTGWALYLPHTPPQELVLPLEARIAAFAPCVYRRTQDLEVKTNIALAFNDSVSYGQLAATLPLGYRPNSAKAVSFTAILSDNVTKIPGHALADTDGTIKLYPHAPITGPGVAILNSFAFVAYSDA